MPKKKVTASKLIKIIVIIILGIAVIGAIIYTIIDKNMNELMKIEIPDIELSAVSDGTYSGSCFVLPINVEVEVTVKDHKITEINITKHDNGRGAAAEAITDRVIEAQSINVDAVTGATHSSKAILAAIANALTAPES